MKIKYSISTLLLFFLTLNLSSCSNKNTGTEKNNGSYKDYSKITAGSVNYYSNGKMKIISDLKNNSSISDDEEGILIKYIKDNNAYLREKKKDNSNELILGSNNKENIIEGWKNLKDVKLSPKGDKVFYNKTDSDGSVSLGFYSSADDKFNEIKTDTLISGNLYEWLDNDSIIYYGVKTEKKINGVFSYNTENNEEKLLFEVKKGIIEYLHINKREILYLVSDFSGTKNLYSFDVKNNKVKSMSNEVQNIEDLIVMGEKIYVLGKRTNNSMSVYILENGNFKRLVYDFPKNIDIEKGIETNKEGSILFIGYDETSNKEDVYEIALKEQSISLLSKKSGEYYFIETN